MRVMVNTLPKFISLSFHREWRITQLTIQAITPTPVLPLSGPTGFDQVRAVFKPGLISAPVTINPMTRQPIPLETKAAEATPTATLALADTFSTVFACVEIDAVILLTPFLT